jgi:hypothetical protein
MKKGIMGVYIWSKIISEILEKKMLTALVGLLVEKGLSLKMNTNRRSGKD